MAAEYIEDTIRACRNCFMCRYTSPHFRATRMESCTPKGYAILLDEIAAGTRIWTDSIIDKFYQSTLEGECKADCVFSWKEDEVARHAREEIATLNLAPPLVRTLREHLVSNGSLYETVPPWDLKPARLDKRSADVLYIAGGTVRRERPETVDAAALLLSRTALSWTVRSEERSTGAELYDLGFTDAAEKEARAFVSQVEKLGPKNVVFASTAAYRAVLEWFPIWKIQFPAGIVFRHASEFLEAAMNDGSLKFRGGSPLVGVGYHDNAQLGRKSGVYEAPRRVLLRLIGEAPLELFENRGAAPSAGSGTSLYLTHPELSARIGKILLNQAQEVGMKTLVTANPSDKTALLRGPAPDGGSVAVRELTEFVADRVKEEESK